MPCDECDTLWRAYENAVFEHVRLCSKLKLALAANSDGGFDDLSFEVSSAENRRAEARTALSRHESAAGHGAASLAAKPTI